MIRCKGCGKTMSRDAWERHALRCAEQYRCKGCGKFPHPTTGACECKLTTNKDGV